MTELRAVVSFLRLLPLLVPAVTALASVVASAAVPESLFRAVPKDAVAAYFVAGPDAEGANAPSSFDLAMFVIERAHEFGLLSKVNERTRVGVDVLGCVGELLDHAHAVVLLDISAAPRPDGGHQLTGLHAAIIIRTNGATTRIEQRIQHLLDSYTNSENSTLTSPTPERTSVFRLRDRRLPDWVDLTWGAVGDHYVLTIGEGSFERIARTMADPAASLAGDPWFTDAWVAADGAGASVAALARFDAARAAADDLLVAKIEGVQKNLRLAGVDRGLWTVGRHSRAVEAGAFLRLGDRNEWRPITRGDDPAFAPGVIPDEASWYVILDVEPRALLRALSSAYLASKSPDAQDKSRAFWRSVEEQVGLSIDRDILALLRQPIVSHDYPKNVFQLPLAWTRLIAVEDPETLHRNLDRMLEAARDGLAKEGPTQLRRDADGVWYLHCFGIAGPAIGVAGHWLVISFSPDAVRKNIDLLSQRHPVSITTVPPTNQP